MANAVDVTDRSHLTDFVACAHRLKLRVWLFGSALTSCAPRDFDVLVLYADRDAVLTLRRECWWSDLDPPLDIIAMTEDEERYYRFIEVCGAVEIRLAHTA